ncbi:MAG: immunoglobulin domain-containing protein [Verrucomicrobiota bacterium]
MPNKNNTQCSFTLRLKRPAKTSFILLMALLALFAPPVLLQAQLVFQDDFESYADTGTLQAAWPFSAGLNGGIQLSTTNNIVPSTGTKSAKISRSDDRSYTILTNFDGSPLSVPDTTHSKFTVYINSFSTSSTVGATRTVAGVGNSTASQNVGIGWFNNATAVINGTADVYQGAKHQGRHSGVAGNFYFNLNNPGTPNRTVGWHKFDVERVSDGVSFVQFNYYVDNILGRSITNSSFSWDYSVLGFGAGTLPGEDNFDGVAITLNHPRVTQQPTNQAVSVGGTATFKVVSENSPTGYQWRFNGKSTGINVTNVDYVDLSNATNDTLVLNNVQTNNVGYYSVIVSNANGSIGSSAATLIITVPSVSSSSGNRTVLQGANFTLSVTANGAPPLNYQWQFNSNNIAGATNRNYTNINAQVSNSGNYRVQVQNAFGSVFSSNALITVISAPQPAAMTLLWKKVPGDYTWLNTDGTQRGLSYNAPSNHVLVVSRTGANAIYILGGDDGSEIGTMNVDPSVVIGGTFPINMVGIAEDGAVFAGNLTLTGPSDPFKLYRWENDDPATPPSVAYEGDPGSGALDRWGDAIDVRGSGAGTQILISSRSGTNAVIFTTADGLTFTPTVLHCDVTSGDIGLAAKFGAGNTLWGKANDGNTVGLRHISFDLTTGVGTTLQNYTNFPASVANLGVDATNNLLAGISIETPNNLRLYGITNLNSDPVLLDYEFFTPNIAGQATGDLDFGNQRLYALNSNNGILAMSLAPAPVINFSRAGNILTLTWTGSARLLSAPDVTGPFNEVARASSPYSVDMTSNDMTFYRLSQ